MVLISIYLRILLTLNPNAPCEEFKVGTFKIYDGSEVQYTLIRTNNYQTEVDAFNGNRTYYYIEWIDECTFVQTFDAKKMSLTEEMILINKDGGIIVELVESTSNNCYEYHSYIKNYEEISSRTGQFCK